MKNFLILSALLFLFGSVENIAAQDPARFPIRDEKATTCADETKFAECALTVRQLENEPADRTAFDLRLEFAGCGDPSEFADQWDFGVVKFSESPRITYLMYPTNEVFSNHISMSDVKNLAKKTERGTYELILIHDPTNWHGTISSTFYKVNFDDIAAGDYFLTVVFFTSSLDIGKGSNLDSNEILITLD